MVAELNAKGIASTDIPSKLEGFSFGEDIVIGGQTKHTLWMANDNDFDPANAGNNNFYVFAVDSGDLTTFQAQNITPSAVPVPTAAWLFGSGLLGLAGFARKRSES